MSVGITLFLIGFVIMVYPQILVAMIAGTFMTLGILLMFISWRFKKSAQQQANSPFMNWFIRY